MLVRSYTVYITNSSLFVPLNKTKIDLPFKGFLLDF